MDPLVARRTWRTVEPLHGIIYFARESFEGYKVLGLQGQAGYFATRSAPMGAVGADVVIATFFNFRPALVHSAIPSAWELTTPTKAIAARLDAADRLLRRLLGDQVGSAEMKEAATLARCAAEAACQRPEGRPLFAGHAGLEWPDEPHLQLWHAQTLLREFRGDGHIAALTCQGLTGCEALVVHGATGDVPAGILRSSRSWPDQEWAQAVEAIATRGWLGADGTLSELGRDMRQEVEDRTDALAMAPYEALGDDGCARLRQLCRPWSQTVIASGELGFKRD
jgi:hypothetical protein